MKLTDTTKKNKNKFLLDYNSKLDETDPEYMEIINNFIFDEIQENTQLNERSQILVILAALITNQSLKQYKIAIEAALNIGLKPTEIKEVLYQTTPYVGLSKVYDFINTTNQVFNEKEIDIPLPNQSTINRENRKESGFKIQKKYFGEFIEEFNKQTPDDQKHFNEFLKGYCFGDFYTRKGLNDQDRELITFSILASLGGCENQLRGHTQANLNIGNDKKTLINTVTILLPFIGFPRSLNALSIINEVCQ